jgi:hypothetical protein
MTKDEVLKLALEALENNRQTHHYCEDTWYSCPKHEEGCANDSEGDECNCGADKANIEIDAAITSLRQAIAELESQERNFCPRCGKRTNDIHTCTPPQRTEQEPVQVSPLEFVEMVMEKEHLIGKPIFWAEWPNKEKNT